MMAMRTSHHQRDALSQKCAISGGWIRKVRAAAALAHTKTATSQGRAAARAREGRVSITRILYVACARNKNPSGACAA